MKFRIDDFEIEEFQSLDEEENDSQNSIINDFADERQKEKVRDILSRRNKNCLRYVINKDGAFVGEITFSGEDEFKPQIGIEIELSFRNQGIGYRILRELMLRLCKAKHIEYFIYTVRNDNTASISLVEKLGGVQVKVLKPSEKHDLAIITYKIPPFTTI